MFLSDSAKVPILTYHSWTQYSKDETSNDSVGLANDLNTLHKLGYTVVPVYWLAQWVVGDRSCSSLPNKIVGITFDDGDDLDWYDTWNPSLNCMIKSFHNVLKDFKKENPSLPWYSPHASTFVIASPLARHAIRGNTMSESWWELAQNSPFMEVYNHSTDHDHGNINQQTVENKEVLQNKDLFPDGLKLPITGYTDNNWCGEDNFSRVNNFKVASGEVLSAGKYIKSKIGVYPDLFAYPYGGVPPYLRDVFFNSSWSNHGTYAAFSTEPTYLTKNSNRYSLPRYIRGAPDGWNDADGLIRILQESGQ